VVNDLQVSLHGDGGKVDQRPKERGPRNAAVQKQQAQPIPGRPAEVNSGKSDRKYDGVKEAADEIKQILVEDQHMLFVLFRDYHGIQDDSVCQHSHECDDHDSALVRKIAT